MYFVCGTWGGGCYTLYKSSLVCLLCLPLPSLHLSDFLGNLFVWLVCVLFLAVCYITALISIVSFFFNLFLTIPTYSSLHNSKYVNILPLQSLCLYTLPPLYVFDLLVSSTLLTLQDFCPFLLFHSVSVELSSLSS